MMKMFGKKDAAAPGASEAPKGKPKAGVYRPRGIETVCPEGGNDQQRFYLSPSQALGERLRDFPLILNGGDDQPTRLQWQFAIAVEAINTLDNYPLQAVVNVHGEDKWDFHRAAFLRALVAGLGDWLNKQQLKSKKGTLIDVLSEGWADAVSLAPAKESLIPVNAGLVEWHLCGEITKDQPIEYLHPDVYRLFMDSFATDPHQRNPISGAVRQAREKMVKRLSAKGIAVHQAIGVMPTRTRAAAPAAEKSAQPSASASDSVNAPKEVPKSQATTPRHEPKASQAKPKPSGPSSQAVKKAGIEMPEAPSKPASATPAPESPTPAEPKSDNPAPAIASEDAVDLSELVRVVRQRMEDGIITANQAGAIFHGTPNGAALIVPKGYDVIAQVLKTEMGAVEALAKSHMVDPDQSFPNVTYRLHRQGRGWAKIKAGVLNDQVAKMLFPEGLEPNPDIKVG